MSDLKARLQAEADSFRAASVKLEGDSHAADLLTEALSRITELEELTASQGMADRESTGWRTIDSAPRDGTVIDVWCPAIGRFADVRWVPFVEDFAREAIIEGDPGWTHYPNSPPTHWQPLPAAPSLDAGRNGGGAS